MIIEIYGKQQRPLYTIFTKYFSVNHTDKKLTYLAYDDKGGGAGEYLEELHYKYMFATENRIVVTVIN
jgi:hypothetical protein